MQQMGIQELTDGHQHKGLTECVVCIYIDLCMICIYHKVSAFMYCLTSVFYLWLGGVTFDDDVACLVGSVLFVYLNCFYVVFLT